MHLISLNRFVLTACLLAPHAAAGRCAEQKMAVPCDTAKFREETSKKADSATKGPHCCGAQRRRSIIRLQVRFCSAAFTKAGHRGYSLVTTPLREPQSLGSRKRRPHPAIKAGCCRFCGSGAAGVARSAHWAAFGLAPPAPARVGFDRLADLLRPCRLPAPWASGAGVRSSVGRAAGSPGARRHPGRKAGMGRRAGPRALADA